jgi:hypothetical protein
MNITDFLVKISDAGLYDYEETGDAVYSKIKEIQNELGLFFWNRGGKEHINYCIKWFIPPVRIDDVNLIFDVCLDKAKTNVELDICNRDMQDFLDCVSCLEENKVKELIKKEGVVKWVLIC